MKQLISELEAIDGEICVFFVGEENVAIPVRGVYLVDKDGEIDDGEFPSLTPYVRLER